MVTYPVKQRITYKPTDNYLVFSCRASLLLLYTVVIAIVQLAYIVLLVFH